MDNIPADLRVEQETSTLGKRSFDMSVDFNPGTTVQEGILSRIPQAVLDTVIDYPAVARLVLEISEV